MRKINLFSKDFDYEEDDYNRLKNLANKNTNNPKAFTNKGTFKSLEFDYEEDSYEPNKST